MNHVEIGSQEWLDMRRKYITASDAAVLMGVSPWSTPLELYHDKIAGFQKKKTAAMQRGIDLEPEARMVFEQLTGHMVRPEWRVHPDIKWMAATFDGINDDGILVEIKVPGEKDHLIALEGKIPEKYMPQLQHQMKVAGVGQCYYFSYRPENSIPWRMIRVQADREFQQRMLEAERAFYDCLVNLTPPKPLASEPVLNESRAWLMKEEELYGIIRKRKELEAQEEIVRKEMFAMCDGQAMRGYRLKIVPVESIGRVEYGNIPELKEVNLEAYRKPTTVQWRTYEL